MSPKVIIISKKNEPSLKHLVYALEERHIKCDDFIHSKSELKEFDIANFKGFFIFCLPPSDIRNWLKGLEEKFLNFFKIYSYNYLVEDDIDSSVFLLFDYIIAGEQENGILNRQLEFLKSNYWRKIPISKLGFQRVQGSKLIAKLFHILERTDINLTNLELLSKQLNVSKDIIRVEIKKNLNMHYSELRTTLLQYYQEYYPEKIV